MTSSEEDQLARAVALMDQGDDQAAEPLLRALVERGDVVATFKLGVLRDRAGHPDDAIRLWRLAAEAGSSDAMNNLGTHLGGEEGIVWFTRAMEAGHPLGAWNLGLVLAERGEVSEAKIVMQEQAEQGNGWAAARLAGILDDEGDDEAEVWAERAAELGCHWGFIWRSLWAMRKRTWAEGLEWALKGLELPPLLGHGHDPRSNLTLSAGRHLVMLGRSGEALPYLLKARRMGYDFLDELIRQCQADYLMQSVEEDASGALELLKGVIQAADMGWNDVDVLVRRLSLVDAAAQSSQLAFSLAELSDIHRALGSALPQDEELVSAVADRLAFFQSVVDGDADHLEDDPDEGVFRLNVIEDDIRRLEDFPPESLVSFPDLLDRETQALIHGLVRDGFFVGGFLAARRLAVGGNQSAMAELGHLWLQVGHAEAGVSWLERAARESYAPALGSHGWALMLSGDHQGAITFYDETVWLCQEQSDAKQDIWRDDLTFSRCLNALHRLAAGGPPDEARATWGDCREDGSPLATLYLAALEEANGDRERSDALIEQVPDYIREDFLEVYERAANSSEGWLRDWARLAVPVLRRAADRES